MISIGEDINFIMTFMPDAIAAAAQLGLLKKEHLAFFLAWRYYARTGEEPQIKEVMYGVSKSYNTDIGKTTAHLGIEHVREYRLQTASIRSASMPSDAPRQAEQIFLNAEDRLQSEDRLQAA